MSIEPVVAAVSSLTAIASVFGQIRLLAAERDEGEVAKRFKREPQPDLAPGSDPRSLNEYLFMHAGQLSLREFAGDAEIRSVVGRAVSRIDDLLESPVQEPGKDVDDATGPSHLRAAENAIQRGDTIGALARLRLWIELELQQLAELVDAPLRQQGGPSRAIRPLTQMGVITSKEASVLSTAVRLANGAVHGEPVEPKQAATAIQSSAEVMWDIAERFRASRRMGPS